jgi:hypothetical protein
VCGETRSNESSFPVKIGPDLTYNGDSSDAFVAKVKADGTGLIYCGYVGGGGFLGNFDGAVGIAVDHSGNAYVCGLTNSLETTFPVKSGPDLTYNDGEYDGFVAKVKADGTGLVYCGYIGGSYYDFANSIALDRSGSAYVSGWTNSAEATFPVKAGPDLTHNSDYDAFVAKIHIPYVPLDLLLLE